MTSTPKRDLRSSGTLWLSERGAAPKCHARPSAESYGVAIIGAGISGALAAAALIGLGKSVVVLDRGKPAAGSTAASTALIQWEIDQPLTALAEKLGEKPAAASYRHALDGVLALRRTILTHGVACGWSDRVALTVAGDAMGKRAMADELKLRRKHGLPSYWIEGRDLEASYGIARTAALLSGTNGELNPVKLTRGLLRRAAAEGMEMLSPAGVAVIDPGHRNVTLELDSGAEIAAAKLIVCSGYEALPQIPASRYKLTSTWALATRPLDADRLLPGRPLIWEQSDPYLYIRTTGDNRHVAGGEDEDFDSPDRRDALIARKAAAIMRKLKTFLPAFDGVVDYAWGGTFASSPTGLPSIGPVPGMPNVFAILGSGGNGITYSALAAEMARGWILGKRHKALGEFGFDRD